MFWFAEARSDSGFVPQLETVMMLLPFVRGKQLHTVQSNSHRYTTVCNLRKVNSKHSKFNTTNLTSFIKQCHHHNVHRLFPDILENTLNQ